MTVAFRVLLFCVLLLPLAAQTTGELRGGVEDASGGAVRGAALTLTSVETAAVRLGTSDDQGRFSFALLPVGPYVLTVEAPGFRGAKAAAVVRAGEVAVARLRIEVGQRNESITVAEAVTPLDGANAQVQQAIYGEAIQVLPVQRNPNLFALTLPGVVPVVPNQGFLGTGSFTSNGGRGRANNVTVDNIVATDVVVTGTAGPLETTNFSQIKEVKVITNNFSAEYGRNSSAQVVYVTKSGTNQLHGEAYEFLQNDRLNARPWFDSTGKPTAVRRNQFGYALGGPVFVPKLYDGTNRTFFFTSYEGQKRRGVGDVRIAQVPTDAMLAQVTDPGAKAVLDLYRLPAATSVTPAFGQVQQSAADTIDAYQFSARGDHQLGSKDLLWGRYSRFVLTGMSPAQTFSISALAGFGPVVSTASQQATLAETHVFAPNLVNEFRFGFGRSAPDFAVDTVYPLGPRITFLDGAISPFGISEGYPQGRLQNTFQYSDTLSWNRGAHIVKVGAEIHRLQVHSYAEAFQRPFFQFPNWTAFAQGRPSRYQQRFGTSGRGNRVWNHFFFAQDDWRVTRNFTLNIGMRLEVAGGVSEVNGLTSNLDLNCADPIGGAGTGPFGCLRTGEPAFDTNYNFGPRVGFAWNPRDSRRWVIRGGYGIAYDFLYLSPINNQRFLPPFNVTQTLAAADAQNTFARLAEGSAPIQQEGRSLVGSLSATARNIGNVNPAIDRGLANPQVQQWSLGVQRDFGSGFVAKAAYVGTKGTYLTRARALNPIALPPAAASSLADETARLSQFTAAAQQATGSTAVRSNRIDGRFNEVYWLEGSANSSYHSLQVEFDKRFAHGYLLRAAYTAAKSIDDVSDAQNVMQYDSGAQQNPADNRDNRGLSAFDLPQRLVLMHQWEPQWDKERSGVWRHLLGGWGFTGITSFRSGFPMTFEAGARRSIPVLTVLGIAAGPVRPNAAGTVDFQPVPSGTAGAPLGTVNPTGVQPVSAYAASLGLSQPLLGNFGSLGRNVNRLNGQVSFDWNVSRSFSLAERARLEVRAELYNTFNNTSFEGVVRNITSPMFGQYTSVGQPARLVQMAARVVF